ncbi:hypothetical protein PACTADRAFT_29086, partial [Pachysolen tannophilus NRRL Y-2460]
MFRDRTNLYISYRRTYPHHHALDHETSSRFDSFPEEEGLIGIRNGNSHDNDNGSFIGGEGDSIGTDGIELKPLPPRFVDFSAEVEENLSFIETKINELNFLYKKNLLPGFNDRTEDNKKIDDLNFVITKNFQKCYNMIKKIDNLKNEQYGPDGNIGGSFTKKDELAMCENIKKKLALRTQNLSKTFRKLQNNYIRFLKDDDDFETQYSSSAGGIGSGSQQSQNYNEELEEEESTAKIESYSREALKQSQQQQSSLSSQMINQREREIFKIAQGVLEISTIFKELENMIIDQGTILDRIDYNINNVVVDLKHADKQFVKSSKSQKRTTKCKAIFLLSLIVFALFLMVLTKP